MYLIDLFSNVTIQCDSGLVAISLVFGRFFRTFAFLLKLMLRMSKTLALETLKVKVKVCTLCTVPSKPIDWLEHGFRL